MSLILAEISDGIGTITLNYQIKRNALSEQLVKEIAATFENFKAASVRVAILRAQPGAKVWSSGHNVAELPLGGLDPLGWQDPLRMLIRDVEAFPAPVIALIEGGVWGGACELVFACDMIIATPEATFAATPAKLGVPYNATGLLTFLNAAPPHIAKELLFTGRPMTAARLERQGIINHVIPSDEIHQFTREIAQAIAHNSPLAIGVMKEQLRILAAAHALSPADFERIQGLRRVVYNSRDYAEGINSFKEKRPPVYLGE
ncbi:methylmalonyl-CoA decarboxylase [Azonexus sp.]|uniref:methylmalonyl-CoA decarboxylase n=1 Tax=Azonexus sp. TaxID=1872668 RepID=UPI0027BA399B|nr:methylmalonyl-CoA decarboxylase [Azonexus sp.]